MVILTAEPRELTFIHMSGKMSLNDLTKMSGESHGIKLPQEPLTFPDPKLITGNPRLFPATPTTPVVPALPVPPVAPH